MKGAYKKWTCGIKAQKCPSGFLGDELLFYHFLQIFKLIAQNIQGAHKAILQALGLYPGGSDYSLSPFLSFFNFEFYTSIHTNVF